MNLEDYFQQYEASHQNPWNKLCHFIGIPSIIISILWFIVEGSHPLAWGLFIVGWGFQFLGHAIEKSLPEFMKNPLFLLIGPLYFLRKLTRFLPMKQR
jgi:uncharacterized membrane protein YGL010W